MKGNHTKYTLNYADALTEASEIKDLGITVNSSTEHGPCAAGRWGISDKEKQQILPKSIKMPLINLNLEDHIDLIQLLEAWIALYQRMQRSPFRRQMMSDKGKQIKSKNEGKSLLEYQPNKKLTDNSKSK